MKTIPEQIKQVKQINIFVDLDTGRCARFLETKADLCPYRWDAFTVDLQDLFYFAPEGTHPINDVTPQGILYSAHDDGSATWPIKDFEGITSYRGEPAKVRMVYIEAPENPEQYGYDYLPAIVRFNRAVQPGEINEFSFTVWRLHAIQLATDSPAHLLNPSLPFDREENAPPTAPSRDAPPLEMSESPKLKLTLFQMRFKRLYWPLANGCTFVEAVTWLLCRHFHTPRRNPDAGYYTDLGINQISHLLKLMKHPLSLFSPPDLARNVKRMGTSIDTVKHALPNLERKGFLFTVAPHKEGFRTKRRRVADSKHDLDVNRGMAKAKKEPTEDE